MNTANPSNKYELPAALRVSLVLLGIAFTCAILADLQITTRTPWTEIKQMASAILQPQWLPWRELLEALSHTIAYALVAVTSAALIGFGLCFFL